MTQHIRRVKLRDQAVDQLLQMISSSNYEAGTRLPPERVLVEQLGVSRTVVREALNSLETRGLLQVEHGRGAVLGDNSARALHDSMELLLRLQPNTLWELMEMREALEVQVASLAAERANHQDTVAMHAVLGKMRDTINTSEGYVEADVEFHELLARSAHNKVLLMMIEPITDLLLASRRMTGAQPGNARRALRAHEEILKQVEAGNAEGARQAMRDHLATTKFDIKAIMDGQDDISHLPGTT